MPVTYPTIATGSIVRLTVPGSRATDGQPTAIPAIVLGQFPEDGILRLFCFHFEGQFMSTASPDTVEILFDAAHPSLDPAITAQIDELRNDTAFLQQQVNALRELVLSGPQTLSPAAPALDTGSEPPLMASPSDLAQVLDTLKHENRKLKSKSQGQ